MNAVNSLHYSSPPPQVFSKWPLKFPYTIHNSFSVKRRRRTNRHNKNKKFSYSPTIKPDFNSDLTTNNQSLKLVVDVNQITSLTSSKLHYLISSTTDAYEDLRTLVTVDENNRLVFSCRRSTIRFTGIVLLGGFLVVFAFKVLVRLGLGLRRNFGGRRESVVVRRDRSLGGREVVVARREDVMPKRERGSDNPLSLHDWVSELGLGREDWKRYRVRREQKLPKWWPTSDLQSGFVTNQEEYLRAANRLVREITDSRTRGNDFMERDIIRLRQICRTSGVRVSFDVSNTRDSFYRASINFILNGCSSALSYSTLDIDGEDARHFIAGLAENIGLEDIRAARMVSAAVAAHTRSCFLQAWALEVQGKHSEALWVLSKVCIVFQVFPPEESSPEMEMVARGLGKHLEVEQRERLMDMFVSVCGNESHRSAAEALGLVSIWDQQDSKLTGN